MLDLPQVTLCCVDTLNHALALRALERSRQGVRFGASLFLTDGHKPGLTADGIEVQPVRVPVISHEMYSRYIGKQLIHHIQTKFALVIQWDGYVLQPNAWTNDFLDFDYLGAPWLGGGVGNGGFSLRSRRLLEVLQDERFDIGSNEDYDICNRHRKALESDYGLRFGTTEVASRFSFEMRSPIGSTFGFHGIFNLPEAESDDVIAHLVPFLPDSVMQSEMGHGLLFNCRLMNKPLAAEALERRLAELGPATLSQQQRAAP